MTQKARARLVDRRLLTGGPTTLRLPYACAAAILVWGLSASLLGALCSPAGMPRDAWWAILAWIIGNAWTGVVLAAVAARWLGGRTATLAGLIHVSSLHAIHLNCPQCVAGSLVSLAACTCIGAFASAEVPSRLAVVTRRISFGVFCVALAAAASVAGVAAPACILTVCLIYLALFQDGVGLRFFTARHGVVILIALVAGASLVPSLLGVPRPEGSWDTDTMKSALPIAKPTVAVDVVRWAGTQWLPWTPWAFLAIGEGLRQGHYALPLGRLLAAWFTAPWMLWAVGAIPLRIAFAVQGPCVSLLAAIGTMLSLAWCRRTFRKWRRPAVPSPRARPPRV